jgi:hypothetical protein
MSGRLGAIGLYSNHLGNGWVCCLGQAMPSSCGHVATDDQPSIAHQSPLLPDYLLADNQQGQPHKSESGKSLRPLP